MRTWDKMLRESVRRTPEQERKMTATFTVGEKELLENDMKQLTKNYYDALKRIKELVEKVEEQIEEVVAKTQETGKPNTGAEIRPRGPPTRLQRDRRVRRVCAKGAAARTGRGQSPWRQGSGGTKCCHGRAAQRRDRTTPIPNG